MTTHEEVDRVAKDLFASLYSGLVRYADRFTGSTARSEDLVQEVFLLLCRELLTGKRIDNPKAWAFTVLRRRISKILAAGKDRGLVFESLDEAAAEAHPRLSHEPTVERDLDVKRLRGLFSLLSVREEEVMLLRMEGFKFREIAECMGISLQSASTLFTRGFKKLRATLRGRPRDPGRPVEEESLVRAS